jgi:GTP-binding protein YchF
MKLGIIGLPQSGKTTIFNALTRGNRPVTTSGGRFDVHTAVVDVPDTRLDRLSALIKPQKTIHAKVTYADIAGLDGSKSGGISGPLLNQLAQMDGFLHVVRCFEEPNVPHPMGSIDAERDIAAMDAELLLNDLISIERKQERLTDERRKGGGRDKVTIEREVILFEKLHATLVTETPLRDGTLSSEEEKSLSGFGLLSRKPLLIVLNLGEGQKPPDTAYPHRQSSIVALQGKLEMDLVHLPPDEAEIFMAEYGIEELGLNRVIRLSYDLLGLISFFTMNQEEVHAWTMPRGANAYEAAGAIHTDLQRGFIRAEVIPWDALLALGGLAEARAKGKLRLEGRDYLVRDGEVIQIRFNV